MTSIYESVHPVVDVVCCPHHQGWFIDASGRIERCDDCQQFPDDSAAAEHVRESVAACVDCDEPFDGVGRRSLYCPALCESCLTAD